MRGGVGKSGGTEAVASNRKIDNRNFRFSDVAAPVTAAVFSSMRYISYRDLKSVYGIPYSWAHLARLEAKAEFPRRVRLSAKRVAWVQAEIEAWCAARNAARDAA